MASGGSGGNSGAGGGGGGAPVNAPYLLSSADIGVPNARVLTQGANITLVDSGPGGTLTISASGVNDPDAWHKTGDSFASQPIIGTLNNLYFPIWVANLERARITTGGIFLLGETTSVSSSSLMEIRKDTNGHVVYGVVNANTGSAALAGFAAFMDGSSPPTIGGEFVISSANLTPAPYQDAAQLSINTINLANGIRVMTRDASPITIGVNNTVTVTVNANTAVGIGGTGAQKASELLRIHGPTVIDFTATDSLSVGVTNYSTAFFVVDTTNSSVGIGQPPSVGGLLEVRNDHNGGVDVFILNGTNGAAATSTLNLHAGGIGSHYMQIIAAAPAGSGVASLSCHGMANGMLVGPDDASQLVFQTSGLSWVSIDQNRNALFSNSGSVPSAPGSGGYMYVQGGAAKWIGSGGTTTTFGPSDPHCDVCGSDYGHEWSNPRWGRLQLCVNCLVDHISLEFGGSLPDWIKREPIKGGDLVQSR